MPHYFEIAVNVLQVTGVYHYHIPPELEGKIQPGHLVIVPFGKQTVQGIVLRGVEQPMVAETRAVIELVDPAPVLTPMQIALAEHLADYTLAPLAACTELMLPPGLAQHADTIYTAAKITNDPEARPSSHLSKTQLRMMSLLHQRGPLRSQQIDHFLGRLNWHAAARPLVKQGLLTIQSILPPPRVHPKTIRIAQLACSFEEAEQAMENLARSGTPALIRRQTMLRFLLSESSPVNVAWLYAESSGNANDLSALVRLGLVSLVESETWRDPVEQLDLQPVEPPVLTRDQKVVWEAIQSQIQLVATREQIPPILLHGVTGSGKTEIYLKAVEEVLRLGRQAIVLVPEIALTPQTIQRFGTRFPSQVGLIHSRLSIGERYDTWRRARMGDLSIVVGPRSALFTPFANLGIIVVDECHDDSYYQTDQAPRYHARQAAIAYARLAGAVCLLGSATPDIATTYNASRGQVRYLHLPERILAHRQVLQTQVQKRKLPVSRFQPLEEQAEAINLPPVHLVDMRLELQAGNRSIFSRQLCSALEQVLDQRQQAILFLNRRGTATYIFCRDCGFVLKCPHCDLPLTYHLQSSRVDAGLLCHRCGYQRKIPQRCPQCNSQHIRHYGTGTERVEAELKAAFPTARTLRWDFETTRQKGAHEIILNHFAAHRADFLVGTQMIAKGLDLPLVTLVGVVLADVGLNLPDYRATERSFQVLTQVAGRAGRSPLGGQVILQTFQSDHYVIQAASRHNYREFYHQELEHRRKLGYPPFSKLVRLEYQHTDAAQAERAARALAVELQNLLTAEGRSATQLIGPVPCFFSRLANQYRWQIVLRGPDPTSLIRNRPLGGWKIEVDPINLL
jgi:primosomal protein N' (replication factor Y)